VAAGNFPILMKTNYYDWATLMHVMLQAQGLCSAVSKGMSDYMEDRMALEVISKVVPVEMMGSIASKPTAKDAWEVIILCNISVRRVRKAKENSLKHKFDSLTFNNGESVDDSDARIGWDNEPARHAQVRVQGGGDRVVISSGIATQV
jgi:hypothetical protein